MKICYASDLHAKESLYRQLITLVEQERPAALLLGGDLGPTQVGPEVVAFQRQWLADRFVRYLQLCQPLCPVYWASGNHDFVGALDVVDTFAQRNLLVRCDYRWAPLGDGWSVLGFPFVPASGFQYKDWERLDESQAVASLGPPVSYISQDGALVEAQTGALLGGRPPLRDLLAELPPPPDPARAILLAHGPPYASGLDQAAFGGPIGSRALASHLATAAYTLACHGHIHESPYLSGRWVHTVGRTCCVNPGQWGEPLHAVIFDTENGPGSLRHSLFGRPGEGKVPRASARSIRREIKRQWPDEHNTGSLAQWMARLRQWV